ncbi:uncharacterized protein EV420DRAFT_1219433, partial [Desarmillaria tabescens]
CGECIKVIHCHLPFHRIEKWNGRYFEKVSLQQLGFMFALGHGGDRCPNQLETAFRKVIVVDVNGYHDVNFQFCFCWDGELDEAKQLFLHRLFPATVKCPETVFTSEVLDNFDIHHCTSMKSAESFCAALRKMSAAELPDDVSDSYRTFMQASHIHRHLQAVRRSGQVHNIDNFITHRWKNCITVHCPACPEPEWNINLEYTLFLDCDGTFNVPRINKPDDPNEESLNAGHAFVVEEHEYQRYLSRVENDPPEKCDCAKLRALKFDHLLKFVNLVVTGIVGFQCVRHVMFKPDATVDMYVGERLYYADRGLVSALKDQTKQRWIRLSYDLVCQYLPNLLTRITKERFPNLTDEELVKIARIEGNIGQLHIVAHILHCLALYCFNHTPGVARSCGDVLESAWDRTKHAGRSLKQMNHGLRHDMLDFILNDWNWSKVVRLGKLISRNMS